MSTLYEVTKEKARVSEALVRVDAPSLKLIAEAKGMIIACRRNSPG
jgi:hypothetical protein